MAASLVARFAEQADGSDGFPWATCFGPGFFFIINMLTARRGCGQLRRLPIACSCRSAPWNRLTSGRRGVVDQLRRHLALYNRVQIRPVLKSPDWSCPDVKPARGKPAQDTLIERYISDGQPVGSRTLAKDLGNELASGDHPQRHGRPRGTGPDPRAAHLGRPHPDTARLPCLRGHPAQGASVDLNEVRRLEGGLSAAPDSGPVDGIRLQSAVPDYAAWPAS